MKDNNIREVGCQSLMFSDSDGPIPISASEVWLKHVMAPDPALRQATLEEAKPFLSELRNILAMEGIISRKRIELYLRSQCLQCTVRVSLRQFPCGRQAFPKNKKV